MNLFMNVSSPPTSNSDSYFHNVVTYIHVVINPFSNVFPYTQNKPNFVFLQIRVKCSSLKLCWPTINHWTQSLEYEHIALYCRICFEYEHITEYEHIALYCRICFEYEHITTFCLTANDHQDKMWENRKSYRYKDALVQWDDTKNIYK
jgi:hypothetical protein